MTEEEIRTHWNIDYACDGMFAEILIEIAAQLARSNDLFEATLPKRKSWS